ncbi:hypothetical protein KTF22_04580, partial [Burkholderia multivorans]|uniref:hypothetical protein n=1 Tax=Burkholderia multivorans TaxID=87883 RepID=UPI001C23AE1A
TTALRLGQNFDAFHVMTRLTDRHKTIPYFKRVLVSSDTWGRSSNSFLGAKNLNEAVGKIAQRAEA